ncbi:MAG: LPP20 family lipoprotein [Motiliproteus sp.]
MNRITLVCLALITGLVGCSTASTPPQWSMSVPEDYPASGYLTGVGEASNREQAEQRALAALARAFEVNINEQSRDFSLFRSAEGDEPEGTNQQVSSRQLIAATQQVIEGASPVEYWQYEQQYLVLVALERGGAEQRLRQKINQLDQQSAALIRYADNRQRNSVVQISALERARKLQHQRTPLNRNLSVVSGKSIAPPVTLAQLEKEIRDRLAELQFQLSADTQLLPQLQHAVGQIGASVQDAGDLNLNGSMDREPIVQQQGWFWLRGALQLTLSNNQGEVIAEQRWPVKISAQEPGMVEQRLKDQINADIANQLYQLLTATRVDAG